MEVPTNGVYVLHIIYLLFNIIIIIFIIIIIIFIIYYYYYYIYYLLSVDKIAVVGAHIQPSAVEQELGELLNVHRNVIGKWGNIPVIMMGDFNAGRR